MRKPKFFPIKTACLSLALSLLCLSLASCNLLGGKHSNPFEGSWYGKDSNGVNIEATFGGSTWSIVWKNSGAVIETLQGKYTYSEASATLTYSDGSPAGTADLGTPYHSGGLLQYYSIGINLIGRGSFTLN